MWQQEGAAAPGNGAQLHCASGSRYSSAGWQAWRPGGPAHLYCLAAGGAPRGSSQRPAGQVIR